MMWDGEIHASTKARNADGSWRARKGRSDEYEAAIATHKAEQAEASGAAMVPATEPEQSAAPAPTGGMPMPTPQPAAPEPTTPQAPVGYEEMANRFVGMMNAGKIADFEAVYRDLGINHADLETNLTSINRLWQYMVAIDAGAGHPDAVQRTMAAAG